VRPETPLVLAAGAVVVCIRWRRTMDWPKIALAGAWMAAGLLAALTPWAARNARTLGRIEFLAPRYAQAAGDFMPRGFYAWCGTERRATVTWLGGNRFRLPQSPRLRLIPRRSGLASRIFSQVTTAI
jgi:hypothetical protein